MKINVISESIIFPTKGGGIHTAFLNHVSLLKKMEQIIQINSNLKTDITHIHSMGPFALYKLITNKNTVLSTHILPDTLTGSYRGVKFLKKPILKYFLYFYNHADLVLALTNHAKHKLEELGVKSRIEVLANPINTHTFRVDAILREAGRRELGLKPNEFVVLGVGHMISRKGFEDFISAARELPDIKFLWVGSKLLPILNAETKEQKTLLKNKPKNILLTGQVDYEKMPYIYNAADVLFFPSYQEIASMVILEAALCGLPIILRDLDEYKDLYKDDYLKGGNLESFVRIIKRLAEDRVFCQKYSKASQELASRFNSEKIGLRMIQYYSSLIHN